MRKIFRGRRIIPCLDIKDGKIVKGVKFQNLRCLGDPFELALLYEKQGADEIALLNVQGKTGKANMISLLKKLSKELSASIIAGGGVYSIQDIEDYLSSGADRVSISSAAAERPGLVREAVSLFGRGKIIVAIDAKNGDVGDEVDLVNFAKTMEDMGAGEILLTSIDADGVKAGYDIAMINRVCNAINIPVIASGGCGNLEHFIEVFQETKCAAALAASVFHEGELTVGEVKKALIDIHFEKSELIPAIIQDIESNQVLMLAYMNRKSLEKTLGSGFTWFYSRSRNELWNKGASSGNYQKVVSITPDCDNDTLLVKVVQNGPACHTGEKSCFYRTGGLYTDGKILSQYID